MGLLRQFAPEVARLSRTGSLRPDCLSLTHSTSPHSADSCQALQADCAAFSFSDLFFVSFVCSLTLAGSDLDREVARREVDDMAAEPPCVCVCVCVSPDVPLGPSFLRARDVSEKS